MEINNESLEKALKLLALRLQQNNAPSYNLIVCGGSALIAANLISRATKDVDIVALGDEAMNLIDPEPLPKELLQAAQDVKDTLGLNENWLNNEPSRDEDGLFKRGLPNGLVGRLEKRDYGEKLKIYFISRLDQISFKFLASLDHKERHINDLKELNPTDKELIKAVKWVRKWYYNSDHITYIKKFLKDLGYEHLIDEI